MAVRNGLDVAYGIVDVVFVLTGGLLMGFALMSEKLIRSTPTTGNVAHDLLLNGCPLTATVVNAALVFFTFLLSLPILINPSSRLWLKLQGWAVVFCAIFTLVLGLVIWFNTLQTRANLSTLWNQQDSTRQSLLQQKFSCCGYTNATSPPFVPDATCPNSLVALQKQGCVGPFANFANAYLNLIFTTGFGVVGVDMVMLLCVVMMVKRKEELERYRHIDEKNDFGGL